jgi:hypothetical protein
VTRGRLVAEPTTAPRDQWFVAPVGEPAWTISSTTRSGLMHRSSPTSRRCCRICSRWRRCCPARTGADERRCHLDLDDSNLARDDRGRLVVLDWENSGPASPRGELAMVAAEYGPAGAEDQRRSEWRLAEFAAQPLTRARIDGVLAALR